MKKIDISFSFQWVLWVNILLFLFSANCKATPYGSEYFFPSNSKDFFQESTQDFELLQLNFNTSNMPIQKLSSGSSFRIGLLLPAGISVASISAQSNDWQGGGASVFPVMATFDYDPGDLCLVGGSNCVDPTQLTATSSALSREFYGKSPRGASLTEERMVYFVLYYPFGSSRSFSFSSLSLSMVIGDRNLYEQWRIKGDNSSNVQNQAPQNSVPAISPIITQNQNLTFSANQQNQLAITDIDAEANSSFTLDLAINNGKLSFVGTPQSLIFNVGSPQNSQQMTISGSLNNLNTALSQGLTFTPNTDFTGNATLTMTTNDNGNTGSGGALTDTDTITITVGSQVPDPNTPPPTTLIVNVPDAQSINKGESITFSTTDLKPFSVNYTGNDDLNMTLLVESALGEFTISSISNLVPLSGSINSNLKFSGSLAEINKALDGLTFTPNTDFAGGQITLNLSIQVVNSTETPVRNSVIVTVLAGDAGDGTANTGIINFTPLDTFIISNAVASASTPIDPFTDATTAKIAFYATRETLSGNITSLPYTKDREKVTDLPKLSRDDFITLKAQLTPEVDHKNIRVFTIIRWVNVEKDAQNVTTLINDQWFQKNRLQYFGSLNGNAWAEWQSPTLPLSNLEYYIDLPNVEPTEDNTYTIQVSAGHLVPPSGLYSFDRRAELYIGYEATKRQNLESQRALFDNTQFIDERVQIFADAISFNIEDGGSLLIPRLELSLSEDRGKFKSLNTQSSNELMTNCEFVSDSSAMNIIFVEDTNSCLIRLTSVAQVDHFVEVKATGILNSSADKSSALTSISRVVVVE
jgi:hypothetical protein